MLACQPQLAGPDGRFDWSGRHYEQYIREACYTEKCTFGPMNLLGCDVGYSTFPWCATKEGDDYWANLCYEFASYLKNHHYDIDSIT